MKPYIEIYHGRDGGNCGPFTDIASALRCSIQYLSGFTDSSGRSYFDTIRVDHKRVAQLILERHNCECKACRFNGETFYHYREFTD